MTRCTCSHLRTDHGSIGQLPCRRCDCEQWTPDPSIEGVAAKRFEEITIAGGPGHQRDNPECPECWDQPRRCGCGGIIHKTYAGEDGEYVYVTTECDRCHAIG